MNWQTMDTLPDEFKDGRRLMLWTGSACIGSWAHFSNSGEWGDVLHYWQRDGALFSRLNPTHWAPMPEGPTV